MIAAFAAGLVASVNPCGFAMLPAYAGFFLGIDAETSGRRAVTRALGVAGIMSLGFLAVFGAFGILLGLGGQSIHGAVTDSVPWIAIVVGAALVYLGVMLLMGWEMKVNLRTGGRGTNERGVRNVFFFGASYAMASLSCALPVFLIVITQSVTADTFIGAFGSFIAYAVGMSLVITAVTVALAIGRDSLVNRIRRLSHQANRIAGVLLVVAGGFIVFYWTLVLRLGADALIDNPLTRWVETASSDLTGLIGDNPLAVLLVVVALLAGSWLYASTNKTPTDPA
jgi:cytochrome c biogenesis protein CcdA